jgi:hypothetical protein
VGTIVPPVPRMTCHRENSRRKATWPLGDLQCRSAAPQLRCPRLFQPDCAVRGTTHLRTWLTTPGTAVMPRSYHLVTAQSGRSRRSNMQGLARTPTQSNCFGPTTPLSSTVRLPRSARENRARRTLAAGQLTASISLKEGS